jgi:uncharacterized protein YneF (UPF0154 family)
MTANAVVLLIIVFALLAALAVGLAWAQQQYPSQLRTAPAEAPRKRRPF